MLIHWLIAVARHRRADHQVPRRIRAALARHLYYKPDHAHFHRHRAGRAWTLCISANTEAWATEVPFVLSGDSFAAVAGVPTLDRLKRSGASLPETVSACVRDHGAQYVFENVGGTFSVGMLDSGPEGVTGVTAFSDFSGYHSCFWLSSDDFFAVGNLPGLVGAFRRGFPERHEVDTGTLSWVPATSMVVGDRTAFAGVRRLRAGHRIKATLAGGARRGTADVDLAPFDTTHFAPTGPGSFDSIDFGERVEAMGSRLEWCRDRGIGFRANLTGGRDTRAIAAILAKSGHLDAVTEFTTHGSEDNGDVLLARRLAPALGVEDRHRLRRGNKARKLNAKQLVDTLARSAFVFSGQLTPYDGRALPARSVGNTVTLMGGGGEVYRQEWGPADVLYDPGGVERALNLFTPYDRLNLVSQVCRDYHETVVAEELAYLRRSGAVNLTSAYYLEERLANWGCAHFSNSPTAQFPLLLDVALARSIMSLRDTAEHVHFEIMRHCDQALLRIPFLNNRWAPKTEARARSMGFGTVPLTVAVERNFPWQFDAYRRYRDDLISFCIENGDRLSELVPARKLEDLRRRPVEPISSSDVKMLFGLVAVIFFVEGAWIRTRDLAERFGSTLFFGNSAGESFRYACEHGPVNASPSFLYRDLAKRLRPEPASDGS